ncbi:hypothetical protein [Maledivibacter halophilus]|uniref:Uncharacterized protein n=1 Tax=Maledivibacter halophilus TaxID=36842 RepID=A0A1T5L8C3_9FIRM|nr:hypothetical protein [Maledivibacter halophilus]SKC68440.1 hypothetical protein SAMN02194393_02148 [Maledivibacter halophilus]SKC71648.1 hypothetical protein SAMN02194393_02504 [Maledivibacter halophilus]SKC80217.1 hypothetical protein SAMN02194393_03459 [Maledivibacter halophilus]
MTFNTFLQGVTTAGVGIIIFFLKKTLTDLNKKIEKNESKIENIENDLMERVDLMNKEFNNLKSDLPFIYTTREDHAAAMNAVDKKMTGIDRKLDKILDFTISKGGQKND